jgi:hypothetical protein
MKKKKIKRCIYRPVGLKDYKNVGQHMYLGTLGFACRFIQYIVFVKFQPFTK